MIFRKFTACVIAIFLIVIQASAQWRIGPEAGLNMSNIKESTNGLYNPNNIIPGARAGCTFDYEFNDNLAIQPGLFFSMMGCYKPGSNTLFYGITTVVPTITTNIYYVQAPFNFVYKAGLGAGRVFIAGGPYLGWGVYGVNKYDAYNVGSQSAPEKSENIKFGSDSASVKPFDFGLNISVGYELPSGLLLRAGYSYGLGNMSNVDIVTAYNTYIYVSVGWLLGGLAYR